MKSHYRPLLLALPFIAFASAATAQSQQWISQLGTSATDTAEAAAPDGSGGVYTTGGTSGSLAGVNAGGGDVWLARHDGLGNQLWILQLGTSASDTAKAVAPDRAGGVYVCGSTYGSFGGPPPAQSTTDAWFARYDGAGNQLWIRQLGVVPTDDHATAIAPDGSGGVYVGGDTQLFMWWTQTNVQIAWLAHYDGAGNRLWTRQWAGPADVFVTAAAEDQSGGVYVCGHVDQYSSGSTDDAWLRHFDSGGNNAWYALLITPPAGFNGEYDYAYGAAPDGSGGVYVTGSSGAPDSHPNGSNEAWLAHYNGAGTRLWIRRFASSADDWAYGAASDGSGGVYVSGATKGSLGGTSTGPLDAWLAHCDWSGNELGRLQLGTSGSESAVAAAPDGSGGVYLSGWTSGSLGGPSAGANDAWLARFN